MKAVQQITQRMTLVSVLVLSGCLDDGGSSSGTDASTGQIHYNGISGLSYQTASQSGKTSGKGAFLYYPGETLTLKVGDLTLAEDIPAQRYVTLLEVFPDIRAALQTPQVDDEGLRTHTLTEQQLIEEIPMLNLTRFILSLDWTEGVREGEGIEIRQRVIDQLNAALPLLDAPIDFRVSQEEFTATGDNPSPANQLLAAICFYPPGDELCEDPPTPEEIDAAPERPENEEDWDPDVEYKEDLQAKRDRILEAKRDLDEVDNDDARTYLKRELKAISTRLANQYYLDNHVASHPASDTGIKSVRVRKINGTPSLQDIEAISTRPDDVTIHAWSWQTADVDYFISGDAGGESEVVMSFQPSGNYRWVRKTLRVLID